MRSYIVRMVHTRAWRNFKRMQDTTVALAALIYAGAAVHAFDRLPALAGLVARHILIWPGIFLLLSLAVPLLIGGIRRILSRYVWMSFQAGFGQTVFSIVTGVILLSSAALFMYWRIAQAADGGRDPGSAFAAYAAGIGILAAQAALVRSLEQDAEIRKQIEVRD